MMEREAKEIFEKWMDCKDAYQADLSCDGNCFSCEYYASAEEEKEAIVLAISALEKQEVDKCCETCMHKDCPSWEEPCDGCYLASDLEDYYEPYTEEEA